ncbi:hypothetical protein LJR231_001586 [Phyllobacterium sp. LjRoot231]|uniref:hypothetical protein n=1 Tax=Phyllobacterium sp. LjRoot231 TaxID=3342289 RepID=UPI003ECD2C4B
MVQAPVRVAPPEHKFRVTFHAVTRYIQRIMGVVVKTPEGMSFKLVAQAHCDAVSMSMDDIKAIILCPAVIAACMVGMTGVSTRDFRVAITPLTGVVVTVAEPKRNRFKRRKLLVKTRREIKQESKEHIRRVKRRPSAQWLKEPEEVG